MPNSANLTARQRRFVAAMLTARSVPEAAKAADVSLRSARRWLQAPAVKATLDQIQSEAIGLAMANLAALSGQALAELRGALALLSKHAGASVADFITVGENGKWSLDLARAEEAGKLGLVKKLWTDRDGSDRLELHDPQAAAARLGQLALDILGERREVTELDDLARRVADLEANAQTKP